jgi:hypothetical protein
VPTSWQTFPRQIAPWLPEFQDIPLGELVNGDVKIGADNLSYYLNVGWGPQTLDLYTSASDDISAAGSFSPTVSPNVPFEVHVDDETLQQKIAASPGYRIRQISVTTDAAGASARFTAIWEPQAQGEQVQTFLAMSDAKFNQHVQQSGLGVVDHFVYLLNGKRRHAAVFSSAVKPIRHEDMESVQDLQDHNTVLNLVGKHPVSVTALEGADGDDVRFFGGWQAVPGTWDLQPDLSGAQLTSALESHRADGYTLHRVQGYAHGTRFLAIWRK